MKVYLAGPMKGTPREVYTPAFRKAAEDIRANGHEVFNPAEKEIEACGDDNDPEFRRKVFKLDTSWICDYAEAIALLPGWENSDGACSEYYLAKALGLEVYEI